MLKNDKILIRSLNRSRLAGGSRAAEVRQERRAMVDVEGEETSTCKEKEKKSRKKMRKQKGKMRDHQAAEAAGEDGRTCRQDKEKHFRWMQNISKN